MRLRACFRCHYDSVQLVLSADSWSTCSLPACLRCDKDRESLSCKWGFVTTTLGCDLFPRITPVFDRIVVNCKKQSAIL